MNILDKYNYPFDILETHNGKRVINKANFEKTDICELITHDIREWFKTSAESLFKNIFPNMPFSLLINFEYIPKFLPENHNIKFYDDLFPDSGLEVFEDIKKIKTSKK